MNEKERLGEWFTNIATTTTTTTKSSQSEQGESNADSTHVERCKQVPFLGDLIPSLALSVSGPNRTYLKCLFRIDSCDLCSLVVTPSTLLLHRSTCCSFLYGLQVG